MATTRKTPSIFSQMGRSFYSSSPRGGDSRPEGQSSSNGTFGSLLHKSNSLLLRSNSSKSNFGGSTRFKAFTDSSDSESTKRSPSTKPSSHRARDPSTYRIKDSGVTADGFQGGVTLPMPSAIRDAPIYGMEGIIKGRGDGGKKKSRSSKERNTKAKDEIKASILTPHELPLFQEDPNNVGTHSVRCRYKSLSLKVNSIHNVPKRLKPKDIGVMVRYYASDPPDIASRIPRKTLSAPGARDGEELDVVMLSGETPMKERRIIDYSLRVQFVDDPRVDATSKKEEKLIAKVSFMYHINLAGIQKIVGKHPMGFIDILLVKIERGNQYEIVGQSRLDVERIVNFRYGIGMMSYVGDDPQKLNSRKLVSRSDPASPRYRFDGIEFDHRTKLVKEYSRLCDAKRIPFDREKAKSLIRKDGLVLPRLDGVKRGPVCPPGVLIQDAVPILRYRDNRTSFEVNQDDVDVIGFFEIHAKACRIPLPSKNGRYNPGTVAFTTRNLMPPILKFNSYGDEQDSIREADRAVRLCRWRYPQIGPYGSRRVVQYHTMGYSIEDGKGGLEKEHDIFDLAPKTPRVLNLEPSDDPSLFRALPRIHESSTIPRGEDSSIKCVSATPYSEKDAEVSQELHASRRDPDVSLQETNQAVCQSLIWYPKCESSGVESPRGIRGGGTMITTPQKSVVVEDGNLPYSDRDTKRRIRKIEDSMKMMTMTVTGNQLNTNMQITSFRRMFATNNTLNYPDADSGSDVSLPSMMFQEDDHVMPETENITPFERKMTLYQDVALTSPRAGGMVMESTLYQGLKPTPVILGRGRRSSIVDDEGRRSFESPPLSRHDRKCHYNVIEQKPRCNPRLHERENDLTDEEFLKSLEMDRAWFNIGKLRIPTEVEMDEDRPDLETKTNAFVRMQTRFVGKRSMTPPDLNQKKSRWRRILRREKSEAYSQGGLGVGASSANRMRESGDKSDGSSFLVMASLENLEKEMSRDGLTWSWLAGSDNTSRD